MAQLFAGQFPRDSGARCNWSPVPSLSAAIPTTFACACWAISTGSVPSSSTNKRTKRPSVISLKYSECPGRSDATEQPQEEQSAHQWWHPSHEDLDVLPAKPHHLLAHKQPCVKVLPVTVIQIAGHQQKIDLLFNGQVRQTFQGSTRRATQAIKRSPSNRPRPRSGLSMCRSAV